MSEEKRGQDDERPTRIIRKIEVTYRLAPDGPDQTFTISHSGDGELVDGVIWNRSLVKKLAYREASGYRDAPTKSSKPGWSANAQGAGDNCVWIHDDYCQWWELCAPPDPDD